MERPYKGIRMKKWAKWVAEIGEPDKRSRIWLGSYSTPVAAARAYDTTVFYLREPSARLNFPDLLAGEKVRDDADDDSLGGDLSATSIRKKAIEVGARVDALEAAHHHGYNHNHHHHHGHGHNYNLNLNYNCGYDDELKPSVGFLHRADLNKMPDPEDLDG